MEPQPSPDDVKRAKEQLIDDLLKLSPFDTETVRWVEQARMQGHYHDAITELMVPLDAEERREVEAQHSLAFRQVGTMGTVDGQQPLNVLR